MEWLLEMLEWFIGTLLGAFSKILEGLFEIATTGVPPNFMIGTHEYLQNLGKWVAVLAGICAVILIIKHLVSLKWPAFEVKHGTVKVLVVTSVAGAYFYFLGAWGFAPVLVIIGLTILFVTKIFKPH